MGLRATIKVAALRRAMSFCAGVSPANPHIPILSHVLATAAGDAIRFVATDLGHEIAVSVPAEVHESGAAAIPAHRMHALARGVPDGAEIALTQTATGIEAKSGRSKVSLLTLPPDDFPRLPVAEDAAGFDIDAAAFAGMLSGVVHAVNKTPDRQYLNGVCLHPNGDKLRAVATDGKVFAWRQATLPEGATISGEPIIPTYAVNQAIRILTGSGAARIEIGGGLFAVECGGVRLISKLVEGTYPDYRLAMRQQTGGDGIDVLTDIAEFKRAVEFSAVTTDGKGDPLHVDVTGRGWRFSAASNGVGESEREIEAETSGGEGGLKVSQRFLLSALGACSFDAARVRVLVDKRVMVLTSINDTGDDPREIHVVFGMAF